VSVALAARAITLPFGPCGAIAHAVFVRRKLEHIFSHRKNILAARFGAGN